MYSNFTYSYKLIKNFLIIFHSPLPKEFFSGMNGTIFSVVSFYSLITPSWFVKSEYEPTGLLYRRLEFHNERGKNKEQDGMKKSEMCYVHDCSQALQNKCK